jgi:hypothetical protein
MIILITLDDLIGFGKVIARFGPDRPFDRADQLWAEFEAELWRSYSGDAAMLLQLERLDLAKTWCSRSARDLALFS